MCIYFNFITRAQKLLTCEVRKVVFLIGSKTGAAKSFGGKVKDYIAGEYIDFVIINPY